MMTSSYRLSYLSFLQVAFIYIYTDYSECINIAPVYSFLPQNMSFLEDKCFCKCMCRRCTTRPVQSIGTQTDWPSRVKSVQATPKTAVKSVSFTPDWINTATQASLHVAVESSDIGLDPIIDLGSISVSPVSRPENAHIDPFSNELDSDPDDDSCSQDDPQDPDYSPTKECGPSDQHNFLPDDKPEVRAIPPDEELKYLVFQSNLRMLFQYCPSCGAKVVDCQFDSSNTGTLVKVKYACERGHKESWRSQPLLKNRMGAGNLLLGAAILLTGSTFERFREFAEVLRMPIMCSSHFYAMQDSYFFPVIHSVFSTQKEAMIAALGNVPVTLVGDGRCDSPGFSAKYGTYSIMGVWQWCDCNFCPEAGVGRHILCGFGGWRLLWGNNRAETPWRGDRSFWNRLQHLCIQINERDISRDSARTWRVPHWKACS